MKTITTSPHFHSGASTSKIMLCVLIALVPSCCWGIFVFGFRALLVLTVSVASACLTEYLLGLISKENTLSDLSAAVTGLLVGMNMPSEIELFIPILASAFAIAVVKWTFGGLGCNWANPAIAGRIFVFFSFTSSMSAFPQPKLLSMELATSASPLSMVKTLITAGEVKGMSTLEILSSQNYPITSFSRNLSQVLNVNPYNLDAFLGFVPGCIGEVSKICLILGGIFLIASKVITWHIPVSFLGTFALLTWIFGGIPNELGLFSGEVVSSLLRGGIILGAFFMATDMVTSPCTGKGMLIFGAGCGFLTFLFRTFGSLPEATSVAILMMNIVTPTIDRFCKPVLFGSKEVLK